MTDREKMVEVMARAIASRHLALDQDAAVQGGCDIRLLIDPYLPKARADVAASLAALQEAGWAVVPVEPTKEMVEAGDEAMDWDSSDTTGHWYVHYSDGDAAKSWAAMLAAAPKPTNEKSAATR